MGQGVPGMGPESAAYKANALPAVLLVDPSLSISFSTASVHLYPSSPRTPLGSHMNPQTWAILLTEHIQ